MFCTLKFDGWQVEMSKRQEMGINKAPKNSIPIRTVEYVKATSFFGQTWQTQMDEGMDGNQLHLWPYLDWRKEAPFKDRSTGLHVFVEYAESFPIPSMLVCLLWGLSVAIVALQVLTLGR